MDYDNSMHDELFQTAVDGASAVAAGDQGRSAHLIKEVAEAMAQTLTLQQCEWLSVAISNGAMLKHMESMDAPTTANVDGVPGEIWDI